MLNDNQAKVQISSAEQLVADCHDILACYLSGQMSERQLTAHLEDEQFAAFYADFNAKRFNRFTAAAA